MITWGIGTPNTPNLTISKCIHVLKQHIIPHIRIYMYNYTYCIFYIESEVSPAGSYVGNLFASWWGLKKWLDPEVSELSMYQSLDGCLIW
jgi:hypothetical protein